ncbi:hypothetical protein ACWD5R_23490 [Streptomyces sp. NPDC002514]|uniref:hypothetical protein n=1 Tax=Streptomyces sp. NPDC001270 TaxID=3364554 RepID=UPI00367D13A6
MTRLLRGDRTRESTGPAGEPAPPTPEDGPEDGTVVSAVQTAPAEPAEDTTGAARRAVGEAAADETPEAPYTGPEDEAERARTARPEDEAAEVPEPAEAAEVPESSTDPESATDPESEAPARGRLGDRLRRITVAVVAAVLVLTGGGFFYGAHQLRSTASAQNRALTDTEATTRVAGDVGNALGRVFSYTPDGLAAAERSARSVLDGRAARQYTELLDRIGAEVTKQRVTLSTQAVRVGVIELDGDSARLLVFLDQVSRRDKAAPTSAAAQLTVTAQRERDQWRIVDIKTR